MPFAVENFQAVRGCYGVQSLRNLNEACAEADANALRRFELAHSRQLEAEHVGRVDFRTPTEQRVEATKIDWRKSAVERHLRGGTAGKPKPYGQLHLGYHPFKFAAKVAPQSAPQEALQQTRVDPYDGHAYPQKHFRSYAVKKWKTIELGPELFGENSN